MGNICRSPTAHGVFEHLVQRQNLQHSIKVDSAGTHAYHVGEAPDGRAQETARVRGFDISSLRARKIHADDFKNYDYILAMDNDNYGLLDQACPMEYKDKLFMFLSFAPQQAITEVPDPYYGGDKGFEQVFDLVEIASKGLLEHIKQNYKAP